MSEKVLSKVNNDIFSYDTTGGVFKMSRVMPTEIHHTQAGVGPDGYILTSTGPNGNGWTWTDPSVIETPLQVLNLPVTDPKTYSTGADGYVLISKGSTDPPLWTNEISIDKVSATNFQCGSRNIVTTSAGCSFTALEIKPSTSGATGTFLINSNGDTTCHGTLSIDSISEKTLSSGITLNSAVKMTNIQYSTNANKLLYNDATGEITYQPDSGSGGTEIVGTSLRSTLPGNNVNNILSISLGHYAGNSGQDEKTIAIGNFAAEQNQSLFGIAIGAIAGQSSQSQYAIALGWAAGGWSQGDSSIAIGKTAANKRQGIEAIAIGTLAGENDQDSFAIAIGPAAGRYNAQGDSAVAIGHNAGNDNQGNYTVALGTHSATNNQADGAVSVGDSAGRFDQQYGGVSVGRFAGHSNQHNSATALGNSSGFSWQKQQAVAIGHQGGCYNQNEYSVAIGAYTGWNNQSWKATALGVEAGKNNQGSQTVAIGDAAGRDNQGEGSIAIGNAAGLDYQGTNCIAIGRNAGRLNDQGNEAVAIGNSAGYDNQMERNIAIGSYAQSNTQIGSQSIAIGYKAGQTSQGGECVAIGFDAGNLNQGNSSVAIGYEAGKNNQKFLCTAIGTFSGKSNQNEYGVALGVYAGQTDQGVFCTAVGPAAGQNQQGIHSVAIGHNAGHLALGDWSVAIGPAAGFLNPNGLTNYIVINAQNTNLDPASSNGFHVKPINSASNSNKLLYNSDTGEITYQPDSAGSIIALNDLTNEITLGNSSNTLFRIPGLGGSNGDVLAYNNGYIEFVSSGTSGVPAPVISGGAGITLPGDNLSNYDFRDYIESGGNVVDASGNVIAAIIGSGTSFTSSEGLVTSTSNYIEITNPQPALGSTGSFSIEFYAKMNDPTADWHTFFSARNDASGTYIQLIIRGDNDWLLEMYHNSALRQATYRPFPVGAWDSTNFHHFIITFGGTTTEKLYMDGVEVTKLANSYDISIAYDPYEPFERLQISGSQSSDTNIETTKYFRLYNGVLTNEDITFLYENKENSTSYGTTDITNYALVSNNADGTETKWVPTTGIGATGVYASFYNPPGTYPSFGGTSATSYQGSHYAPFLDWQTNHITQGTGISTANANGALGTLVTTGGNLHFFKIDTGFGGVYLVSFSIFVYDNLASTYSSVKFMRGTNVNRGNSASAELHNSQMTYATSEHRTYHHGGSFMTTLADGDYLGVWRRSNAQAINVGNHHKSYVNIMKIA